VIEFFSASFNGIIIYGGEIIYGKNIPIKKFYLGASA